MKIEQEIFDLIRGKCISDESAKAAAKELAEFPYFFGLLKRCPKCGDGLQLMCVSGSCDYSKKLKENE